MRSIGIYILGIVISLSFIQLNAQVHPENGAVLNYTQVLLEVPEVPGATWYEFSIIEKGGNFKNPLVLQKDSSQVTIVNGLDFGKEYQWKVQAYSRSKKELYTDTFHFKTGTSPYVDSNQYRFRIIQNTPGAYKDGIIFLDYSKVAINRDGVPVWYLPELDGINIQRQRLRDLKMTDLGTITFLSMKLCREIALDGSTIWETPGDGKISGDTVEFYHHEFTRLVSGNYMVLGKNYLHKTLTLGNRTIDKIPMSVIIEYNAEGDTVWTWSSGNYVTEDDILKVGKKVFSGNTFGHMNGVYVNERKGKVYTSFRDLNTVAVIDKNTRRVIRTYGDKVPSDTTRMAKGFFKKQHAPILMENGKIILFNNNQRGKGNISSVQIFNEPKPPNEPCAIEWEFSCDFDDKMPGLATRMGNVQPLDTLHYLVNMGTIARLFEVTRDKKITWDCLPESFKRDSSGWRPFPNYRLAFRSSLYPSYFSFSLRKNKKRNPYLRIENEGSENDEYTILIYSEEGKVDRKYKTGIIKPGHTYRISLKGFAGQIKLQVFSTQQGQKSKTQTYFIQK